MLSCSFYSIEKIATPTATTTTSDKKNTWALVLFTSFAPHSTEAQIQGQNIKRVGRVLVNNDYKKYNFYFEIVVPNDSFMVTGTDFGKVFFEKKTRKE